MSTLPVLSALAVLLREPGSPVLPSGPGAVVVVLAATAAALLVPAPRPWRGPAGATPMEGSGRAEGPAGTSRRTAVPVGASVLVALAVLVLLGVAPGLVVPVVVGAGALLGVGWLARVRRAGRAARATEERVREACESLAEDLAAGSSAERALVRSAADWPRLVPVLSAHGVGGDVPSAWRSVADGPGAGGLRLVGAAWQVSSRTGQGLALALRRVATDLRAAEASRRVVDSELASARATGRLVAALPVVAWLMGSGAGQHPVAWLVGGPAGWTCLVVGGGLLLLGLAWIELLAARVSDP